MLGRAGGARHRSADRLQDVGSESERRARVFMDRGPRQALTIGSKVGSLQGALFELRGTVLEGLHLEQQ